MIRCLTGTHSTGKSTLLTELKHLYPVAYFSDSTTREVTTKEERRLDVISDQTQANIFQKILEREVTLKFISLQRDVFMDRSFVDFVAYTKAFQKRGCISEEFLMHMENELKNRVDMYDTIYYLPIEFEIEDDGIRSTDKALQVEVDSIIKEYLLYFNQVVTLKGSLNERISQIRSTLNR